MGRKGENHNVMTKENGDRKIGGEMNGGNQTGCGEGEGEGGQFSQHEEGGRAGAPPGGPVSYNRSTSLLGHARLRPHAHARTPGSIPKPHKNAVGTRSKQVYI